MKLLLINSLETTSPGGINKVVFETAKYLSTMGYEISIFQPNPNKLQSLEIYSDTLEIIRYNSMPSRFMYGFNPFVYFTLKKFINKNEPDIVHIHGYHSLFTTQCIFMIRRINRTLPIVFSPYLDIVSSSFMGKYILAFYNALLGKRIMRKSEQIVAVSNFEATTLINEFKIYPERISIIPLGVDIIDTTKAKKIDNSINLLYVGYLIKRKNVNYVLDALNSLIHEYGMRNVRLSIVGDGPEKHALLKMAKRLDVEDFIKWHSFVSRPELVSIIKGSDILLLLSGSESFGIVVAETLAFGTSVIVTKRAALEEFSGEPGCFIIDNYPPDPQEVAKLIIEICNGEKYVSLSRSSFSNRIRTWGRVADDYNKLYKDIVHC